MPGLANHSLDARRALDMIRRFCHRSLPRFHLVLLCCGAISLVRAGAAPNLSVGSMAGAPASTIGVPVNLSGNTTGVSIQFDLTFDTNRIASASAVPVPLPNHLLASGSPASGVLRVIMYSPNNTILPNGSLMTLQLTLSSLAAQGLTPIQITNALLVDASSAVLQPLGLQLGLINISAGAGSSLTLLGPPLNGQLSLLLFGPSDKRYVLQSSIDLFQWFDLRTNVLIGGQASFTDSPGSNSAQRFYRAKYLP